jgi:hypothetical protein
MVPLVSGNLSVDWMTRRAAGASPPLLPAPGSTRDEIASIAALGFGAVEDYVGWGAVEPREGAFDWSFHRANVELVKARGLRYVVYPWLHVVPPWFAASRDFVPFRCREHRLECGWPSTFASSTLDVLRRFYEELERALGDAIDAICVGMPADYGEVGYPTGMGEWVARLAPPRDHVHTGLWCADDQAAAAIETAQRAGTSFADAYVDAQTRFVDRALAIVRSRFPDKPLWVKLGHASERLAHGVDPTAIVRVAARHGAGVRTTQATCATLFQKRIATPCRHFAVPLASESPVDVGRETVLRRLFDDATSGVVEYFEYPEHMVGARDLLDAHGAQLDGASSDCDVGLLFSSRLLRDHPEHGMPPRLLDLGETLRDRFDYELVDEAAVEAGALASLSVVALLDLEQLPDAVERELDHFVARGGTLVVGPDVALGGRGPIGERIARAPSADEFVELAGTPAPSLLAKLGADGDSLHLAGSWFGPEDAAQFRGTAPIGERCRWTGARASLLVPARRGVRHLLEIDGWVHPQSHELDHAVVVDGVRVGAMKRAGLQRFAAWIEPQRHASGRDVVEVALECQTFVPRAIGAGADERELGAVVIWARLTEAGAPAASDGAAPRVELVGTVREGAALDRLGPIVVSRERPLAKLVALLDHVVRTRSRVGRLAARELGAKSRVRWTKFADRWLLFDRAAGTLTSAAITTTPEHDGAERRP